MSLVIIEPENGSTNSLLVNNFPQAKHQSISKESAIETALKSFPISKAMSPQISIEPLQSVLEIFLNRRNTQKSL